MHRALPTVELLLMEVEHWILIGAAESAAAGEAAATPRPAVMKIKASSEDNFLDKFTLL